MNPDKKVIFWGTPEFALPSLQALNKLSLVKAVITQADKPAGRQQKLAISPVKNFALKHKLTLLQPVKLDQEFIVQLKKLLPATFVIVAYGKIIPQEILDLSALPAVNIHPSRLPELRGPSPIQTALLQGLKNTAVTLMQLDAQMDHGPILAQTEAIIESSDDYLTLSQRLSELGAEILLENLPDYLDGKLKPKPQDDSKATFCKLLKKEQGQLDFNNPAISLQNQIRAFIDWPGSFAKIKDLTVKIIRVKVSEQVLEKNIWKLSGKKLLVGTATQALEILELQPAGKKVMSAEEFINGYQKLFI